MTGAIVDIRRHPVKSLGGESLVEAQLSPGRGLPHDRRYALVPKSGSAPPESGWRPKSRCVVLVRHAALASVVARYDDASGLLVILAPGRPPMAVRPEAAPEREMLEQLLDGLLAAEVGATLSLAAAGEGGMIGDVKEPLLSLLNLASLDALERQLGAPLDPRRFRANLHLSGLPAWAEREWQGRRFRLGEVLLEVVAPIGRCAATEVNPDTTARDAAVLRGLAEGFGHTEMGVYVRVLEGGRITRGDRLEV